ncbi:MAG: DUF4058 family protein [Chloroflexi bacterium]|nr:DUF4058 family protein [Chloroflexota bacterium]
MMPFPGMDPYLEAPDIWPDFHDSLAGAIRALLNAALPPPYYSRIQMRPEMGIVLEAGVQHRMIPDVVLVRRPEPPRAREPQGEYAVVTQPRTEPTAAVEVRVRTDPFRHAFVEVRDAAHGHRLITLIEIASPSNKRPGPDRRAYEIKQQEILESDASLIEIDLLRGGRRLLPYPDLGEAAHRLGCDYLVMLNRASTRMGTWMDYVLYPVDLREILPCISVPLAGNDPDVLLDLQVAAQRVYAEGPYLRAIDYTAPPDPPLDEDDAAWADSILRAAHLR